MSPKYHVPNMLKNLSTLCAGINTGKEEFLVCAKTGTKTGEPS